MHACLESLSIKRHAWLNLHVCSLLQQATRLQRRCYWLLESEDDIVLVHYLNIDKAKGKTEDSWAPADPEMARRPAFTVTSGGVHGLQVRQRLPCCMPATSHFVSISAVSQARS